MPAAKGGLKGVRRNVARDKATRLVAQAHREGWGVQRLAREAQVSDKIAADVLASASAKVLDKADRELGVFAADLRGEALKAVPRVVSLASETLTTCESILETLRSDIDRYGDAGIPGRHGETPASVVLAGAAQRLAGAMASLGATIKDLTGLGLAERVAEAKAKAEVKATGQVKPWDVEVVAVPIDE